MNDDAPASDIVNFGGAGDLSWRKRLPALRVADRHGRLDAQCRVIGVGRHDGSTDEYRDFVTKRVRPGVDAQGLDPAEWTRFVHRQDREDLDAGLHEPHELTPLPAVRQDQGHRVALVTGGCTGRLPGPNRAPARCWATTERAPP